MSVYSNLDPHDWVKNHFHLRPESLENILGFFMFWIVIMLFSYVISLLIYCVFSGFKILAEGLSSLIFH